MMENEQTPQEKRIGVALVIKIKDLYVKDIDVAQLRRSFGHRTPHTERDCHFKWQLS